MNDTTDTEAITASQRRRMFQELIGADPENNHQLWSVLDGVINAACDERDAETHEQVAELARHFPALERALLLVWSHVARIDNVTPCDICESEPSEVTPTS